MTAGDMAEFVGHDADELFRGFCFLNQAGIEEDVCAARDEGVDLAVLDEDDVDAVLVDISGFE